MSAAVVCTVCFVVHSSDVSMLTAAQSRYVCSTPAAPHVMEPIAVRSLSMTLTPPSWVLTTSEAATVPSTRSLPVGACSQSAAAVAQICSDEHTDPVSAEVHVTESTSVQSGGL